jgi:hypothetical protein
MKTSGMLVSLAVVALLLVGCGKESSELTGKPTPQKEEETHRTSFWRRSTKLSSFTSSTKATPVPVPMNPRARK